MRNLILIAMLTAACTGDSGFDRHDLESCDSPQPTSGDCELACNAQPSTVDGPGCHATNEFGDLTPEINCMATFTFGGVSGCCFLDTSQTTGETTARFYDCE